MPKKNRDNVFRARTRKLPDDKSIQVDVASKPGKPGKRGGRIFAGPKLVKERNK